MGSENHEVDTNLDSSDSRPAQQNKKKFQARQQFTQSNNNSAPRQYFYNQSRFNNNSRRFYRNQGRVGQTSRNNFYNQHNDGNDSRRDLGEEKKLAMEELVMGDRKFLIEVNENNRGKYVKILEHENVRRKIVMTISVVIELRDRLKEFIKANESNDLSNEEQKAQVNGNPLTERRIKTEAIIRDNRRYFLDLKENQDSRFLRFTMMTQINKSVIIFPANELTQFSNVLKNIINEHASTEELQLAGDNGNRQVHFESQSIRAGRGTIFYFDVGIDRRGANYLRISDVRHSFRTAIAVPCDQWSKFKDVLTDYIEKLSLVDPGSCSESAIQSNNVITAGQSQ